MNKFFLIIALTIVNYQLSINNAFAQSPQQFSYQGVARDNSGVELANQNIGLRISLRTASPGGSIVYQETHSATTSALGLFNIAIGGGSVVTGTFSTIDWAASLLFVQVEMDATGGTTYQNMGTSQLLSVPYALHANTSFDNKWEQQGINITNNNVGNVGINNSTPLAKLHITGATDRAQLIIDAASGQTPIHPLIRLRDNNGNDLLNIHSDYPYNTFVGVNAGISNDANGGGMYNTFIGRNSGRYNTTGGRNTGLGVTSLFANTTGYDNTALGMWTLAANTTGYSNTAVGISAMYASTTGIGNTAIGTNALTANTIGTYNTALGKDALAANLDGNYNTAVGTFPLYAVTSGSGNTALGYSAGYDLTTGSNNIIIGKNIDLPLPSSSNMVSIGNLIYATGLTDYSNLSTAVSNGNVGIGTDNPTSKLQVVGLPVYNNNSAALGGGLTEGAFYRTPTGTVMVVY